MANYSKTSVGNDARTELHDKLSLTGAEVSVNTMASVTSVPTVHSHKQNEWIYGILSGKGKAVTDSDAIPLQAGDWLRIAPQAKRQLFAADDEAMTCVCIQVRENSLDEFTMDGAVVYQ